MVLLHQPANQLNDKAQKRSVYAVEQAMTYSRCRGIANVLAFIEVNLCQSGHRVLVGHAAPRPHDHLQQSVKSVWQHA